MVQSCEMARSNKFLRYFIFYYKKIKYMIRIKINGLITGGANSQAQLFVFLSDQLLDLF